MPELVVVAAALIRDERVLAARRTRPPELAGGWEFPGGKVEPGESDVAALARECREELQITIDVGALLGSEPLGPGRELRLYRATLISGEPTAGTDHDELRWLAAGALDDLAWLPADRPLATLVRAGLLGLAGSTGSINRRETSKSDASALLIKDAGQLRRTRPQSRMGIRTSRSAATSTARS